MTSIFDEERAQNRMTGYDMIAQEARQFKRLQHLSNHDVAFRMAISTDAVRKMRKARNQLDRPLYETGIDYAVRVLLGGVGIKTTGDLFEFSDRDLLAIQKIGEARIAHIRKKLQEFFA